MFRLTNSVHLLILDYFVFHPLTSGLLVDMPFSVKHHYSGTICPTLSITLLSLIHSITRTCPQDPSFLLWTLNALPMCVQLYAIGFVCVHVCVCFGSDEKDVE